MALDSQPSAAAANRFSILNYEQVLRLVSLMDSKVTLAAGCFSVLHLVQCVRSKLNRSGVQVRNTRLNGGAATFVIGGDAQSYNDVDIIFDVDLPHAEDTLELIRQAVFATLDDLHEFSAQSCRSALSASCKLQCNGRTEEGDGETEDECASNATVRSNQSLSAATAMRDACIRKLIKVYNEQDRWSLIALSNISGKNVELKFVNKIRRPFEFTVDAFQVILDSLLSFYENNVPRRVLSLDFYPTVAAENVYGNFTEAHFHLQNKIIFTRDPEEIRGGGLLRYCRLIVEGYRPSERLDVRLLQEFMCSRFFIDFPTLIEQEAKLRSYLDNHFPGVENHHEKYRYLLTLCQIVAESTICLMNYDRQQTISLILCLAQSIVCEFQSTACNFVQPFNNVMYYRTVETPLSFLSPISSNRPVRSGRSKLQAPRMRNRRPISNEHNTFANSASTDNNSGMFITVL